MDEDKKQSKPALSIIPLKPQAIRYHNEMFPKMMESVDQLTKTPISVFICGPSDETNPITQKKIDIINDLRGREVTALIGEEEVAVLKAHDREAGKMEKTDNAYEIVIAKTCDLVIVIRSSPGSIAETHEFIGHPDVSYKTAICIDKTDSEGYSSTGLVAQHRKLQHPIFEYTFPDDIDSCRLKTQLVEWVQTHQIAKGCQVKGLN